MEINFLLKSFKTSSTKTLFEVVKKVKKRSSKKFVVLDVCFVLLNMVQPFMTI